MALFYCSYDLETPQPESHELIAEKAGHAKWRRIVRGPSGWSLPGTMLQGIFGDIDEAKRAFDSAVDEASASAAAPIRISKYIITEMKSSVFINNEDGADDLASMPA